MTGTEIDTLQEKLNRLTADFEDFTYIVSHDFKAPLRAISNLSDWIVEDLGTDLQEDVAESLRLLKSRGPHGTNAGSHFGGEPRFAFRP